MTDPKITELIEVAQRLEDGDHTGARDRLEAVIARLNADASIDDTLAYLVAAALSIRLDAADDEDALAIETVNPYLQSYDLPHHQLFDLCARRSEVLRSAHQCANRALIEQIGGHDEIVIVDIGIGQGQQLVALLDRLDAGDRLPKQLTVVGIDPQPAALATAEQALTDAAAAFGVELTFHAIHALAEGVRPGQWTFIKALPGTKIVNAAFSLHHLLPGPQPGPGPDRDADDVRCTVLAHCCALDPLAVVVAEYCADMNAESLTARCRAVADLYGALFSELTATIENEEERLALAICFYGRQIVDQLAGSDPDRTERFEPVRNWRERFQALGMETRAPPTGTGSDGANEDEAAAARVRQRGCEGYEELCVGETPVVAVLCAYPTPEAVASGCARIADKQGTRADDYLPETYNYLDPAVYLAALTTVAKADGVIDPRERAFIDNHAKLMHVDTLEHWSDTSIEAVIGASDVSAYTKAVIVRDLIFLAQVDREYHERERAEIKHIAQLLGYDDEVVADAEALVKEFIPPRFDDCPAWFRRYWYMAAKYQL